MQRTVVGKTLKRGWSNVLSCYTISFLVMFETSYNYKGLAVCNETVTERSEVEPTVQSSLALPPCEVSRPLHKLPTFTGPCSVLRGCASGTRPLRSPPPATSASQRTAVVATAGEEHNTLRVVLNKIRSETNGSVIVCVM